MVPLAWVLPALLLSAGSSFALAHFRFCVASFLSSLALARLATWRRTLSLARLAALALRAFLTRPLSLAHLAASAPRALWTRSLSPALLASLTSSLSIALHLTRSRPSVDTSLRSSSAWTVHQGLATAELCTSLFSGRHLPYPLSCWTQFADLWSLHDGFISEFGTFWDSNPGVS